jgi:hypothetical protein
VVALLVVAAGALYAYRSLTALDRSTPSASVNGYFHALSARDDASAWNYDADSRNNPGGQAAFIQSLQADDASYGAVRSAHITQVSLTAPSQAIVIVSVVRANSPTPITYTIELAEYDGTTWLIITIGNQ